jgi:hypothetical protein
MVTEEEARRKWCPFVRDYYDWENKVVAVNRGTAIDDRCWASDCMAWRWGLDVWDSAVDERRRSGYCGLAAKP